MLFFNRSFLFGIVVLFALAACGGGDGDDDTTVNRAWGTHELIETDDAGDALDPQIAFDAIGNALAVWEQDARTRFNIWANRYE
jgi:hypothetical protein